MSKKKSSTFVVDLPILTISGGSGLELAKGGRLHAGGHFYATDSSPFVRNDNSVAYVFIQVECDATLDAAVTIGAGASVATARAKISEGDVTIYAFVHPMYRTKSKGGAGYYLPIHTPIQAGHTYPASNDDPSAPEVGVKIELIPGGISGKLTSPMPVIADTATHRGNAHVDVDA